MCGISGFFLLNNFSTHRESLQTLRNMTNVLRHRGPNASGYWSSEKDNIYLGHRRLSIIDLSKSANQPMCSNNERYIIIFNGEIYNFKKLKNELKSSFNVKFKTQSDTEVILELIVQFGFRKALDKIIGMFSLAVWDKKEKNLFLAIDPLGKKPLYWAMDEKNLIFASEIKSILKFKKFRKTLNHQSLSEFLKFSYIKAPNTIFKEINKLEPGTFLMFSSELKVKRFRYWYPKTFLYSSSDFVRKENIIIEELHDILNTSVSERLTADVPVGILLSGGIDSSLIASLAKTNKDDIKTYSVGFENKLFDESVYAKKISNHIKTNHTNFPLDTTNLDKIIEKLPEIYDEPFGDSSQIPTFLICNQIKKDVTVALSGDGGDEVFGGYSRYLWAKDFLTINKFLGSGLLKLMSSIINYFPNNFFDCLSLVLPKHIRPNHFGHRLKKIAKILNSKDEIEIYSKLISSNRLLNLLKENSFNKKVSFKKDYEAYSFVENMQLHDIENYLVGDILVKVDRASMSNSLEIRSPFLDRRVVEYSLKNCRSFHKIKNKQGKLILRKILKEYLPEKLFNRPKMGFGVPIDTLLNQQLNEKLKYFSSSEFIKNQNLFHKSKVDNFFRDYKKKGSNLHPEMWNFFIFQSWYSKWMN
tara:strand:+ start:447 stop:2372 length:1926 start_codon:yes stop_codon:yes gene_type:complete